MTNDKLYPSLEEAYRYCFSLAQNIPGATWTNDSIKTSIISPYKDVSFLNGILNYTGPRETLSEDLTDILQSYRSQNIKFIFRLSSDYQHLDKLNEILIDLGLKDSGPLNGMWCEFAQGPNWKDFSQMVIKKVTSDASLEDFLIPFGDGFEIGTVADQFMRDWYKSAPRPDIFVSYVGYLKGRPVACASYCYDNNLPVIYNIAVAKEYQKQNLGYEITEHCMREVQALGCAGVGLFAADNVVPFYQQIGFQKLGHMKSFVEA